MGKWDGIRDRILSGNSDTNIRFVDLRGLLKKYRFQERVRGDHFIFTRSDVVEIINIQPRGANAKPYQVAQVRRILTKYPNLEEPDVQ